MKIDVLTLFPEMFVSPFAESIVKRAIEEKHVAIDYHNIRDFTKDKHNRVDDYLFGGGAGMLMQPEPVDLAIENVKERESFIVFLTPSGESLTQNTVHEFSKKSHLILLCGHYEGIDQRVLEKHHVKEISIGDYVLTGGELAAMVLIDAVTRILPGVLPKEESFQNESHYDGLLEQPQYTRPRDYQGMTVPEVLLSGNHKLIAEWKFIQSVERTKRIRPDLIETREWTKEERKLLKKYKVEV